MGKIYIKLTIFALVLSVVAVFISGFTFSKAKDLAIDDEEFSAKVEKGIEDFIEKQRVAQATGGEDAKPVDVSADDDAVKGDENAPITIVEFSDFQCPYCSRFFTNTLPELTSAYIDTGKVRLVHRDFPLSFHNNAKNAALAAECAKDQKGDKGYYTMHDKLYANNTQLTVENLKAWAGELGFDTAQFNDCLDSEKFADEVDNDFKQGQSYGVTGTPAFFINGKKVSGAQPFEVFKTIIEEELAK